jgi:hypothetical protein
MILYGSSLTFNVANNHLRVGLRLYFTAMFQVLALISDKYYHNRTKARLMKGSDVNISQMTGWLSLIPAARFIKTQKCLPVGLFAIIMIVAHILAFFSDILVSGLVKSVEVPGRCDFLTGVVVPVEPVAWESIPDPFQPAYRMVTQSQVASKANGGLSGIFVKSNGNSHFRAEEQDILGHWECQEAQPSLKYNKTVGFKAVFRDLIDKGYLYENTSDLYVSGFPSGSWDRFLAWSPSADDKTREAWNLKAAYNHGYGENQAHLIRTFSCSMKAPSVEWILTQMYAVTTLSLYKGITAGMVYQQNNWDQPTEVASILESVLESIIMIGWGGDVSETDSPIGDPTQGCMIIMAEVPWPVGALVSLVTLVALLHMILLLWSERELHSLQSKSPAPLSAKDIMTKTPNGLIGWMVHAVREHNKHDVVDRDSYEIRDWKLGNSGDGCLTICSGRSAPLNDQNNSSTRRLAEQSQSSLPESCTQGSSASESSNQQPTGPESTIQEPLC